MMRKKKNCEKKKRQKKGRDKSSFNLNAYLNFPRTSVILAMVVASGTASMTPVSYPVEETLEKKQYMDKGTN